MSTFNDPAHPEVAEGNEVLHRPEQDDAEDGGTGPAPGAPRAIRRWRTCLVAAVAALSMSLLAAPAPAQAMILQSGSVCTPWGVNTPANGINVSYPRVSLASGEAVYLLIQAWSSDGRRYDSNWAYARGDSDWVTQAPAGVPGGWIVDAPRDGSGVAFSLQGSGLKVQAVVWLLPHTAGTDPNATGRWERHDAVHSATGSTWCSS